MLHTAHLEIRISKADEDLVSTSLCYVDIYALQEQILLFYVLFLDNEHVSFEEWVCP